MAWRAVRGSGVGALAVAVAVAGLGGGSGIGSVRAAEAPLSATASVEAVVGGGTPDQRAYEGDAATWEGVAEAADSTWGSTQVEGAASYKAQIGPDGGVTSITATVAVGFSGSGAARYRYCEPPPGGPEPSDGCMAYHRRPGLARASVNIEAASPGATRAVVVAKAQVQSSGASGWDMEAEYDVEVECETGDPLEGAGDALGGESDQPTFAGELTVEFGDDEPSCWFDIEVEVGRASNDPRGQEVSPADASGTATVTITFLRDTPAAACAGEDLEGLVSSGDLLEDGHDDPMAGIRMELLRDAAPVGEPVATDREGRFCFPAGTYPPGDYTLRASLVDAAHARPLFETRIGDAAAPVHVDTPVSAGSWGEDLAVTFTKSGADAPLYDQGAEAAAIHRNSARFLAWVIEAGIVPEATLAENPVIVRTHVPPALRVPTGASPGASPVLRDVGAYYLADARHGGRSDRAIAEIVLGARDSAWEARDMPTDFAPENAEWHELGHHVGFLLSIATGCSGAVNHGGWANHNTCDSLMEGFAIFLALAGSQVLDIDRLAEGYGTTAYGGFGDFEDDGYRPWTFEGPIAREDMAVAELLLDLADGPDGGLAVRTDTRTTALVPDTIAVGAPELVRLLAEGAINSVTGLYEAMLAAPTVPAEAKVPSLVLFSSDAEDLTALDAAFLGHGFHPVFDQAAPAYRQGQPVARTDHVPDGPALRERRHIEATAGSALRIRNAGTAGVTVRLVLAYGSATTQTFVLAIPAGLDELVPLDLPPVDPATCDAAAPDAIRVSLAVDGSAAAPAELDQCAYEVAVRAATAAGAEAAVTFDAAAGSLVTGDAGPLGGDAAPPLAVGVLLAGLLAGVTGGAAVAVRRRRRTTAPGGPAAAA